MSYIIEKPATRKRQQKLLSRDKVISNVKVNELIELIKTIPLKIAYRKDRYEGIGGFYRRLKRIAQGKDHDFRLSFYLNMIDLLGYEIELKPKREPIYSYIDKRGYIVIEKGYLPFCRLVINPDDYLDFSMIVGLENFCFSDVYTCYRCLYFWYFKKHVTSFMRYHIIIKIKEELSRGNSIIIKNVLCDEGIYRGKRE